MTKEQKKTDLGKCVRIEFKEALECYSITEDHIIDETSTRNYFAEALEVYEQFLNHYRVPNDTLI